PLPDDLGDRAVAPRQLLVHAEAGEEALLAAASILGRELVAREARLGGTVQEVPWELLGLLVPHADRAELRASELARPRDQVLAADAHAPARVAPPSATIT